jgi:hypothetical protein
MPRAAPDDAEGGYPALLFVGAGVVLLLFVGAFLLARLRRSGG